MVRSLPFPDRYLIGLTPTADHASPIARSTECPAPNISRADCNVVLRATEKVEFDLSLGTARGNQAVLSQSPWGILKAAGFEYSPKGGIFYFSGRPTLVLHANQSVNIK